MKAKYVCAGCGDVVYMEHSKKVIVHVEIKFGT